MLIDRPGELATALPGWIPAAADDWPVRAPTGFLAEVVSELGTGPLRAGPKVAPGWTAGDFWSALILQATTGASQYDALRRVIARSTSATAPVACVALAGRGFHGQHGRSWATAAGNLHLSAVIGCDLPAAGWGPVLPALPAVALCEAVSALGGGRLAPGIKWINDILLDGAKVAGTLTAARSQQGRLTAVVLGVGLNVRITPAVTGDPLAVAPTDLGTALGGDGPELGEALGAVLDALARRWRRLLAAGPDDLLAAYRQRSAVIGRRVAVWPEAGAAAGPPREGEVVGIAPGLGLLLRGQAEPVVSGRLVLPPPGNPRPPGHVD